MSVQATTLDPETGSVEAKVARIIEQAQAQGLQLVDAVGMLPRMIKGTQSSLHIGSRPG